MDMAFERSDWIPTADGQAILRNNQPLLAYIAGKPAAFTSKDHNFYPGETVEKQTHRHQQLAGDGDGRLPLVARTCRRCLSAARVRWPYHRDGTTAAYSAALRAAGNGWRRGNTN